MSWKDLAMFNMITSKDPQEKLLNAMIYADEVEKEEQELREQELEELFENDEIDEDELDDYDDLDNDFDDDF